MAGQRVGLFGPHDHPALVACAAAIIASGNRPQFRNENVFNADQSHAEPFDAIVVIGDSDAAERVMKSHEEREPPVPIYNIAAAAGVPDEQTGKVADPLEDCSAYRQFVASLGGPVGAPAAPSAPDPDAALGRELVAMLSHHTGERGVSEGAVDTLTRIIAEREQLQATLEELTKPPATE